MSNSITDEKTAPANKEQRDAEILRLWRDGWSAARITGHLDIKASTVASVIHRNKVGRRRIRTFGLDDAPIEAWRQAMLPHLQELADAYGFDGMREARARLFFSAFCGLSRLRRSATSKIGSTR